MKRIEVRGLITPDRSSAYSRRRQYQVFLGNSRRVYFTSVREARQFQADTNRFLNTVLHDLNFQLGQAYVEHRQAWPLMFRGGSPILGDLEVRLRNRLAAAEDALDRSVRFTRGPNGMSFAWKYLGDAGTALEHFFRDAQQLYRYKTQGIQLHQCAMHERQAKRVIDELRDYGTAGTGERCRWVITSAYPRDP